MELINFQKVHDGKYLKNYEITYRNKAGKSKKYEIISRRELEDATQLGATPSGVSIVATCKDRLLLLHEFRMGINRTIYNLCAGMLEDGETIEECIARELYEETGLKMKYMKKLLPPSFSAVAISDITTYIAFVEVVDDNIQYHTSDNEEIHAAFYSKEQVKKLIETDYFSSRAQMAAYFFTESV